MKIEIGVDEKGNSSVASELFRLAEALVNAIPGLKATHSPKASMTADQLVALVASQVGELVISHANLEIESFKQEITVSSLKDAVDVLKEQLAEIELQHQRLVDTFSKPPSQNILEFDSAMSVLKDYLYDIVSDEGQSYYMFKVNDLPKAFDDAVHHLNFKLSSH